MIARSFVAACLLVCVVAGAACAETGIASVYGYEGEKTASGERANPRGLTAAHRTLPFGTRVKVTNMSNGRVVYVRINDRGPFKRGRVIDITPAAAQQLGMGDGLAKVSINTM
jgi:rare lipoprotein A